MRVVDWLESIDVKVTLE
ncbi:hypothetical protein [Paenibacillus doosanensis]